MIINFNEHLIQPKDQESLLRVQFYIPTLETKWITSTSWDFRWEHATDTINGTYTWTGAIV